MQAWQNQDCLLKDASINQSALPVPTLHKAHTQSLAQTSP